jgi:hypothetical protein
MITRQAGYLIPITVHRIRQAVTNETHKAGVTASQHKHLLGQTLNVYEQSYIHSHTAIDIQGIMSGEKLKPQIADRLNSAQRFVCEGIPIQLSAQQRADVLENDTQLQELQGQLANEHLSNAEACSIQQQIKYRKRRAIEDGLKSRQQAFYRRQVASVFGETEAQRSNSHAYKAERWSRLMQCQPSQCIVADTLSRDDTVTSNEGRTRIMNELIALAGQLEPTAYRPDEAPIEGALCPVPGFELELSNKLVRDQWTHIHYCRKSHLEESFGPAIEFCELCLTWIRQEDVGVHLEKHLQHMPSDCGVFCFTKGLLVSPGLCPFCLGESKLEVKDRFVGFEDTRQQLDHLVQHFERLSGGHIHCPHPSCSSEFDSEHDLIAHFEHFHGIEDLGHAMKSRTPSAKLQLKRPRNDSDFECEDSPQPTRRRVAKNQTGAREVVYRLSDMSCTKETTNWTRNPHRRSANVGIKMKVRRAFGKVEKSI